MSLLLIFRFRHADGITIFSSVAFVKLLMPLPFADADAAAAPFHLGAVAA